jgi:hypothetical protein
MVSFDPRFPPPPVVYRPTSGLAIASFVLSIVGICLSPLALVGAILGHVAYAGIRRQNLGGAGLAIAAFTIGWVITVIWLGLLLLSPSGVGDIFQGFGDFFSNLVS